MSATGKASPSEIHQTAARPSNRRPEDRTAKTGDASFFGDFLVSTLIFIFI